MAKEALANKYRPKTFEDVTEQASITAILKHQLETNTTKNAYLFCGGAGTGKTTCARIFAGEINRHQGSPIEMDAASNSSVEDVRNIISQAKTQSFDSEYKVFIIDECHSISNAGWQSFLKLIEEPPTKSIFIFCTTDPQKIPKTILSRVQRYDFQRISHNGVVFRLKWIIQQEFGNISDVAEIEAIEYIAKIADGGMRDAITLLDKCLSYSNKLTIENTTNALGLVDYSSMIELTRANLDSNIPVIIETIENIHMSGKDLKLFIREYTNFVLDVSKYKYTKNIDMTSLPKTNECKEFLHSVDSIEKVNELLKDLVELNSTIKWETNPKAVIEAKLVVSAYE